MSHGGRHTSSCTVACHLSCCIEARGTLHGCVARGLLHGCVARGMVHTRVRGACHCAARASAARPHASPANAPVVFVVRYMTRGRRMCCCVATSSTGLQHVLHDVLRCNELRNGLGSWEPVCVAMRHPRCNLCCNAAPSLQPCLRLRGCAVAHRVELEVVHVAPARQRAPPSAG